MEVLTKLVVTAGQEEFLSSIAGCSLKQRISIYADE
jgi:hypothetical protein